MKELNSDPELRRVLESVNTIAVIGAHFKPERPAYYVPEYLKAQGYRVLPVNPVHVGKEILGETVVARADELSEPVDMVDVFRRSEAVPGHLEEILAMKPLPKVVWLQQGIRNDEVAEKLMAAGIEVVQDHCALAEHKRLHVPPKAA